MRIGTNDGTLGEAHPATIVEAGRVIVVDEPATVEKRRSAPARSRFQPDPHPPIWSAS
jgi:hypothetical protein